MGLSGSPEALAARQQRTQTTLRIVAPSRVMPTVPNTIEACLFTGRQDGLPPSWSVP
jgi:hypothetical protein